MKKGSGVGTIPLTNGSGSGSPKNMRIPGKNYTLQKKTVLEWEWQCTATESNYDVPACLKIF
jgi:hypothetical protein